MEENESYRLMVEEKTLSGEFLNSNLFQKASAATVRSLRRSKSRMQMPFSNLQDELSKASHGTSETHEKSGPEARQRIEGTIQPVNAI